MSSQRPGAVTGAIWLQVAVMAMSGLTALLTLVFEGDLVEAWGAGRRDVGSVEPPAYVPVAITMFVVVALLALVLLVFFAQGHNWARVLLAATVVMMAIATIASLRADPPVLFLVLAVLSLMVDAVAFASLWDKDVRVFVGRSRVGSGARS